MPNHVTDDGAFSAFEPDRSATADGRIIGLEVEAIIHSHEILSLRASRHVHGEALQRHELMLADMARLKIVEGDVAEIKENQQDLALTLVKIQGVIEHNKWQTGMIIGILVFVATAIARHFGF